MKLATPRSALFARTQPHVLTLTGGEEIQVPHPDFVLFPAEASGDEWFIVQRPPGAFLLVDAATVATVRQIGRAHV